MTRRHLKWRNLDWLTDRVNHSGAECLIWPFSKNQKGYGQVSIGPGDIRKAHRVMCTLAHGEPPTPKHLASHTCGNGHLGCVNPKHLRWQTNSENQLDRRRHGTSQSDVGTNPRKLSKQSIAEIKFLRGKVTTLELAKRYGVVHGTIDYHHRKARQAHRS